MTPVPPVYNCVSSGDVVLTAAVASQLVSDQVVRRVHFAGVESATTPFAEGANIEPPSDEVPPTWLHLPLSGRPSFPSFVQESAGQRIGQWNQCVRFGVAQDKGRRTYMEDAYTAVTDTAAFNLCLSPVPTCCALFGVFDGHGGVGAANFVSENILRLLLAQEAFPMDMKSALREAFLQTDMHYFEACQAGQQEEDSGSTALAAVIWDRQLYVANAGDCRAVLCRRGKAVDLTTDHKPTLESERQRIVRCGGTVCPEGLLNGELSVARGIGDYHIDTSKSTAHVNTPLTAEPELAECTLTSEDEFLLMGCDGLWDVFSSQRAVEFARQRLREHNDPARCSSELVQEALNMHSADNVSVLTVCLADSPPPRRVYSNNTFQRSVSRDGLSMLAEALRSSSGGEAAPGGGDAPPS